MKKVRYYVLAIALIIALTTSYHLYMRPLIFFEKETGIKLPLTAKTIVNNKDKGAFGDGTVLYVYKLDKNQIDKLLTDNIENQPSTNIEIILIDLSWNRIIYFTMDT